MPVSVVESMIGGIHESMLGGCVGNILGGVLRGNLKAYWGVHMLAGWECAIKYNGGRIWECAQKCTSEHTQQCIWKHNRGLKHGTYLKVYMGVSWELTWKHTAKQDGSLQSSAIRSVLQSVLGSIQWSEFGSLLWYLWYRAWCIVSSTYRHSQSIVA